MITIVIAQDEEKIKKAIVDVLRQEGYDLSGGEDGKKTLRITGGDRAGKGASLEEKVIELEDALYNERRGVLYKSILDIIEKPLIEHALERTEGNQVKAAKILGINRNTIRSKIKRLGIAVTKWKIP